MCDPDWNILALLVSSMLKLFLARRFIDYEYAGYNPVALDIANHWCEYAADYHASPPHLLDYSKLPKDKQQKLFTRAYVRAVITLKRHKEEMVCF